MPKIALHHTLFDWAPTGVVAVAAAPKGGKLVSAARESGAIEIYEVNPSGLGLSVTKVIGRTWGVTAITWRSSYLLHQYF